MASKRVKRAKETEAEGGRERRKWVFVPGIYDLLDSFRYTGSGIKRGSLINKTPPSLSLISNRIRKPIRSPTPLPTPTPTPTTSPLKRTRPTADNTAPPAKVRKLHKLPKSAAAAAEPIPDRSRVLAPQPQQLQTVTATVTVKKKTPGPVDAVSKARKPRKLPKEAAAPAPVMTTAGTARKARKPRKLSKAAAAADTATVTVKKKNQLKAAEKKLEAYRRVPHDFNFKPPRSCHRLIQEDHTFDHWRVLVICMFLNITTGKQVKKVIEEFFAICPDAETTTKVDAKQIGNVIHTLGLQNKRAEMIKRLSVEYLRPDWTHVTSLHGIGKYAADAYAIFCTGRGADVRPEDHKLVDYWNSIYGNDTRSDAPV